MIPQPISSDITKDVRFYQGEKPIAESISDICWITNQHFQVFACSMWNGEVRFIEVAQKGNKMALVTKKAFNFDSPAVSCCWNSDNTALFVGLGNREIKAIDVNAGNILDLGKVSN